MTGVPCTRRADRSRSDRTSIPGSSAGTDVVAEQRTSCATIGRNGVVTACIRSEGRSRGCSISDGIRSREECPLVLKLLAPSQSLQCSPCAAHRYARAGLSRMLAQLGACRSSRFTEAAFGDIRGGRHEFPGRKRCEMASDARSPAGPKDAYGEVPLDRLWASPLPTQISTHPPHADRRSETASPCRSAWKWRCSRLDWRSSPSAAAPSRTKSYSVRGRELPHGLSPAGTITIGDGPNGATGTCRASA